MLACPRDGDRFNAARLAATPRNCCPNFCIELHRIQVPPAPFWGGVGSGADLAAFRARERSSGMRERDHDLIAFQIKIDSINVPGLVQPKQGTVMLIKIVHPQTVPNSPRFCDQPLKSPKNHRVLLQPHWHNDVDLTDF